MERKRSRGALVSPFSISVAYPLWVAVYDRNTDGQAENVVFSYLIYCTDAHEI